MKIILATALLLGLSTSNTQQIQIDPIVYTIPPPPPPTLFVQTDQPTLVAQTDQPTLTPCDQQQVNQKVDQYLQKASAEIQEHKRAALDEIDQMRKQALNEIQQAGQCLRKGDRWQLYRGAFFESYRCIHDYTDGDKKCQQSSQCEGDCITYGDKSEAFCERTDVKAGCFSIIEQYPSVLCVD